MNLFLLLENIYTDKLLLIWLSMVCLSISLTILIYFIPVFEEIFTDDWRSLLSPHIPHGIHMDSMSFQMDSTHSIWNMFWLGSQPFQPFHSTWNVMEKRNYQKRKFVEHFYWTLHMKNYVNSCFPYWENCKIQKKKHNSKIDLAYGKFSQKGNNVWNDSIYSYNSKYV